MIKKKKSIEAKCVDVKSFCPPPPLQMHPPSPKDGSSPRNGMCSLDALVMAVPSPGTPTMGDPHLCPTRQVSNP